jgi:hypothetical protein
MPVAASVQAHAQRGTNCAQAILHGFRDILDIPMARIEQAAAHGGGRAPEGLCGALHSALELTSDPGRKQAIRAEFERQAGALTCREVRALRQLSCRDCVRLAAELTSEHAADR